MKKTITACAIFIACFNFYVTAETVTPKGRRLRQILAEKLPDGNVHVGATTSFTQLKGPAGDILRQEFGYITPENDFKQHRVHPAPGKWDWKYADGWVKYAEENNQLIRIHGPISPQCSPWAKGDDRTKSELEENLREYMTALCKRYNGKKSVRWMDVVNETVDRSGQWMMPLPGNNKWENPWPKIGFENDIPSKFSALGGSVPLYIIQAFEIANKNAPDIKLVINQHGEMSDKIWNRVKDLVRYLRGRGLRVDGIGWQGHIREVKAADWSMDSENIRFLGRLITWAHKNELEFHVTENNIFDRLGQSDKQGEYSEIYGNIIKTVLSKRDTGVVTWNLWELEDQRHYKNKKLVVRSFWDRKFRPKRSYYKTQQILESLPNPKPKERERNTDR